MTRSTRKPAAKASDREEGVVLSDQVAATTGRYVVVMSDEVHGDQAAVADALRSVAEVSSIASTTDFGASVLDVSEARTADAIVFAELGIAVVAAAPDRVASISAAAAQDRRILAIEPERIHYAITESVPLSVNYLRGYRDAVTHLYEQATGGTDNTALEVNDRFADTSRFTWGLQATAVSTSSRSGQGVSVAVLDTGFDLAHSDFAGRGITAQSFVPGEPPQDGHGHGTHCVGTSCGPAAPSGGIRRYGVACKADIFVGKVLSNQGTGTDTNILAGMSWAIANGCRIISMSLGAPICTVLQAYETAGRRALNADTLIVAAAGNNADRRFGRLGCVGPPANSRSIMAVTAVDSELNIANFSAQSTSVEGGKLILLVRVWRCTHPGRCRSSTTRSMARAWRHRMWPESPRCGPRRRVRPGPHCGPQWCRPPGGCTFPRSMWERV